MELLKMTGLSGSTCWWCMSGFEKGQTIWWVMGSDGKAHPAHAYCTGEE